MIEIKNLNNEQSDLKHKREVLHYMYKNGHYNQDVHSPSTYYSKIN